MSDNREYQSNIPQRLPGILADMFATFKERASVYKDPTVMHGEVMRALFPNGLTLSTPAEFSQYFILAHVVGKLTRYVSTQCTHVDSAHDMAVYAAILQAMSEDGHGLG